MIKTAPDVNIPPYELTRYYYQKLGSLYFALDNY